MKIVVTGPESSGKSTLVKDLAKIYQVQPVYESARAYLSERKGQYEYDDLLIIAKQQQQSINKALKKSKFLLSDTDLLTIKIWAAYKYGKCDEWIVKTMKENKPDMYLLCKPDILWVDDPLRENPNDRSELFEIYKKEISTLKVGYRVISGQDDARLEMAIDAIQELKNQQ